MANAEIGSSFVLPVIPFISKAHAFCDRSPKDVLEWAKNMWKVVKCKSVDIAEGMFDLVEALFEGDALTHWQEYKHIETMFTSKNSGGLDTVLLGVSLETLKLYLQELKKCYFPKNLAWFQKAYIHNYVKKLNKLGVKTTAA
eukprot:2380453-Ditylum_brightwellii.AAC.1